MVVVQVVQTWTRPFVGIWPSTTALVRTWTQSAACPRATWRRCCSTPLTRTSCPLSERSPPPCPRWDSPLHIYTHAYHIFYYHISSMHGIHIHIYFHWDRLYILYLHRRSWDPPKETRALRQVSPHLSASQSFVYNISRFTCISRWGRYGNELWGIGRIRKTAKGISMSPYPTLPYRI